MKTYMPRLTVRAGTLAAALSLTSAPAIAAQRVVHAEPHLQSSLHDFRVVEVASGLINPHSMVFTPEGDLLRDGPSNGLGCAPFDYDHDDVRDDNSGGEHIRETSWFRIDSHGSLDVLAATSGQINVTVVLQDDGGVLHGGRDSTTQHLLVQVLIVYVCHPT